MILCLVYIIESAEFRQFTLYTYSKNCTIVAKYHLQIGHSQCQNCSLLNDQHMAFDSHVRMKENCTCCRSYLLYIPLHKLHHKMNAYSFFILLSNLKRQKFNLFTISFIIPAYAFLTIIVPLVPKTTYSSSINSTTMLC